jgi:hypothetical protein
VITAALAIMAAVAAPVKMEEFAKGLPTLAISKKYIP